MKFEENQECPECGGLLLMMYGAGWDFDRLLCSTPKCDYEYEFETTTIYDEVKDD